MTKLIYFYEREKLFTPSKDVLFPISSGVSLCINDMKETLREFKAVGISAIQIGAPLNLMIISPSADKESELLLINPKIIRASGWRTFEEGCLSYPGLTVETKRRESIDISYQDMDGETIKTTLSGLESIIFQHEYDHLMGRDFLSAATTLGKIRYKMFMNTYTGMLQ